MARYRHPARKKRLIKKNGQTKWAPFWTVVKAFGKGRRIHPSRLTVVKRSWRRSKTKV